MCRIRTVRLRFLASQSPSHFWHLSSLLSRFSFFRETLSSSSLPKSFSFSSGFYDLLFLSISFYFFLHWAWDSSLWCTYTPRRRVYVQVCMVYIHRTCTATERHLEFWIYRSLLPKPLVSRLSVCIFYFVFFFRLPLLLFLKHSSLSRRREGEDISYSSFFLSLCMTVVFSSCL